MADSITERNPRLRGLGFYNPREHPHDKVTFVGVGGIGSFAAFGAAKLGVPSITLIDPDTVEEHNYGNQLYAAGDVGQLKVSAMWGILSDEADYSLGDHPNIERTVTITDAHEHSPPADAESQFDGVVVSGLDSMKARDEVWQAVKLKPQIPLYLDARLGGQVIVVYALKPINLADCEAYERTLHSDDEAEEAPCTERGVIDVGLMVGSVLTQMLRMHFNGEPVPPITVVDQESLTIQRGGWVE